MSARERSSSNSSRPPRPTPRGRTSEIAIAGRESPVSASAESRENKALQKIAATSVAEPYAILQGLLAAAVDLCGRGPDCSTAGVSFIERAPDGGEQFRWVAMTGCVSDHIGVTSPRDFSHCGECLDKGAPILFSRPDLKYDYLSAGGIEFTEMLVVPFAPSLGHQPLGTAWVASHPPRRYHFDGEDVRLMESIARFSAAAYSLAAARDEADEVKRHQQEIVAATSREMRTPLNTIAGSAYLLSLGAESSSATDRAAHLRRIDKSVELLLAGVNGLAESSAASSTTRSHIA